jgi:membrane protease YdiL (CAAX protease family)
MTGTGVRVVGLIVAAILLGATLFGLWHLVVGGLINGNPRAGTFGLVLALAAGVPLVAGLWIVRRRRRHILVA